MKQISDQLFSDLVIYFLADIENEETNERVARRIRIALEQKLNRAVQREQYTKRLKASQNDSGQCEE